MLRRRRHPESPFDRRTPERRRAIEEYLDARGRGRSARRMLDEVAADASMLDDLAADRAWIDLVRTIPPAPDQTDRILDRLGLDAARFNRRGHRFALFTRRLAIAAVLSLAFVLGMWARSSMMLSRPIPSTAARHLQQAIESIPAELDPLGRVRGLVFDVGSTLAPPPAADAAAPSLRRDARNHEHERARSRRGRPDHAAPGPDDSFAPEPESESIQVILRSLGIG